jgi:exoribonuclease R
MVLGILKTKDYRTFELCDKIFEGASIANHGLPGDTMSDNYTVINRCSHKNIIGVLELAGKARYGFTARNFPIYLFTPWNEAYPPFYIGSSHKDTDKNVLAVVDFESWESGKNCPRGICKQVIGPCGDLQSEELALLIQMNPKKWRSLSFLNNPTPPSEGGSTLDSNTFHIDPPGCKDIDDAITMWFNQDKSLEVRIHIADVASTLNTNEWLWEAQNQCQTIYKDGAVVGGMFPSLVEEKLSLLPGKTRMTLTLGFTYDSDRITNIKWYQQEIEVKESYTYESILGTRHAILLQKVTSCIANRPITDPHDWVAELMLFYNKTAANVLHSKYAGVLRRHSPPDMERLKALGSSVPPYMAYSSGEYCSPMDDEVAHWGLSSDVYCHASSPIRRWVDCLNQASLINILFHQFIKLPAPDINHLNAMVKKVKKYERDLLFVKELLLNLNSQKVIDGIIVETSPKMRVWIESWKQIITIKGSEEFKPADKVSIKIFFDAGQRNWKRRMVLSCSLT